MVPYSWVLTSGLSVVWLIDDRCDAAIVVPHASVGVPGATHELEKHPNESDRPRLFIGRFVYVDGARRAECDPCLSRAVGAAGQQLLYKQLLARMCARTNWRPLGSQVVSQSIHSRDRSLSNGKLDGILHCSGRERILSRAARVCDEY